MSDEKAKLLRSLAINREEAEPSPPAQEASPKSRLIAAGALAVGILLAGLWFLLPPPIQPPKQYPSLLTLANPTGRTLTPAAAPILIERIDRAPLAYADVLGLVSRDDPRLATFPHELLAAAAAPLILESRASSRVLASPARAKRSG
jgi:hypothetical protein